MDQEIEADLHLLQCIRASRAELIENLCKASGDQDSKVIEALRLDSAYHFAEFFFLLQANGYYEKKSVWGLADMHNRYIAELLEDDERMRRMNLKSERMLQAIFTGDTMPRLLEEWAQRPGRFDQSNLARFLVTIMSTETCRKLVVAFTRAGFLERARTSHGTVVVQSTGVMERLLGESLRKLRLQLG
jgi:hypothetical protein